MAERGRVRHPDHPIYMPYTHNFLTRGNGHRILISDIQLLQWYF